ncbi:DUF982 domain-containing protein [Pseudorhizobium halotolerans]|uniref:DUF982 domain-containing protein n=1 Tax=Pseudorhizobium halotolerans TaxID=1233081 RepID=UPI001157D09A|nr:DUF982 domain-containing protein [Pseudorhizobium halotolerans]
MISSSAREDIVQWRVPVAIRIGYGPIELVQGPAEACRYLADRWPFLGGTYHDLAESGCRAAMSRRASVEEARSVFISAAQEACLLD